jgi:molecular chaperone HscB
MDEHRDVTIPTRCHHCDAVLVAPVACQRCHTLYPEATSLNYFQLFNLPPRFQIDAEVLHRRYLLISRSAHPDFFEGCGEDMSSAALKVSAEVNHAYATLREPRSRAEYMLWTAGGKTAADDKSVSERHLDEVFAFQEEIEAARASDDPADLAALRERLRGRLESMTPEIGRLADAAIGGVPETLDALRRQLNEAKYIENLLEKL